MPREDQDRWAEWLAERRFGGDSKVRRSILEELASRRDKVLDLAQLAEGETLLDVGCGEGLIAFGALARGAGEVIFADISGDLLAFCQNSARDLGVLPRCRFVRGPADDLGAIADETVDVVTTRAVLIYVARKSVAFTEVARVLRPGGRISLFEPINRFAARPEDTWPSGYDLTAVADIATKLRRVYDAIQPPESDPMLDFDERDLIDLAAQAGFFPITLLLEAEIRRTEPRSWESFLHTAPNPNVPTLAEAMNHALTPPERHRYSAHLRPLVENGHGQWRMALAHLVATKM
jgi:arsenite methyltransferase